MASKQEPRERNRGRDDAMQSHGSSGLKSTQSRSGEKTVGGPGEGVRSGRPDRGGNRSGGQGNVSQQSNADRDSGAASRQTSTASEEKGQL